jgi:hypothetical protein
MDLIAFAGSLVLETETPAEANGAVLADAGPDEDEEANEEAEFAANSFNNSAADKPP